MAFPGAHEFARASRQGRDSRARAYLESLAGYGRAGAKSVDECSFARGTAVRTRTAAEEAEEDEEDDDASSSALAPLGAGVRLAQAALQEELDSSAAREASPPRGAGVYRQAFVGAPDYVPGARKDDAKPGGSAVAALRARVAKLADASPGPAAEPAAAPPSGGGKQETSAVAAVRARAAKRAEQETSSADAAEILASLPGGGGGGKQEAGPETARFDVAFPARGGAEAEPSRKDASEQAKQEDHGEAAKQGGGAAAGKPEETDFMKLMAAWSSGEPEKQEKQESAPAKAPAKERRAAAQSGEEKLKHEMREATQTSPLLARMRLQLAEARVSKPPPEYASFCQQLRDHGEDLKGLPVAEVVDVKRARRVSGALKEPVLVEARSSWRPRRWSMAYWSYECGDAAVQGFRRWPPLPSDKQPSASSSQARVDEFSKYVKVLQDVDSQCLEESYLVYPRFFAGGWAPFASTAEGRALWEEDLESGRQMWNPPGLEDLTDRWVKMFCGAVNMEWKDTLSSLDRMQIGPPGAVARLHVSDSSAHEWYGQVQGKRAFILFAPGQGANLYAENDSERHVPETPSRHSPVDVFHPSKSLAKFHDSKAHVALLQPGEMLVVPQGWWVYSVTLEASSTLSRRFWNTANKAGMSDEFARMFIEQGAQPGAAAFIRSQIETFRIQIQQDSLSDEDD